MLKSILFENNVVEKLLVHECAQLAPDTLGEEKVSFRTKNTSGWLMRYKIDLKSFTLFT
jgi:hypothetical protein